MKKLIETAAFPWVVAVILGGLMGFLVGPAVTGWVMHETLPLAFRAALGIIVMGVAGLIIEKALSKRPAPVAADRKEGKVDRIFGVGRVLYTVVPNPQTGRIQFDVTTFGVSGKRFRDKLMPMLSEIEGVEWGNPIEPGTLAQQQAVRRFAERKDAIEAGETPPPPVAMQRSVSGVVTAEASLLRVIERIEECLGSAQPL